MRKTILSFIFLLCSLSFFAQKKEKQVSHLRTFIPIEGNNNYLTINKEHKLEKGDFLQVYLPATQKFMFIKNKKIKSSGIPNEAIDKKTKYKENAISNIQELNISESAKKIAGKKAEIIEWELSNEEGYIVDVIIDNKEYEIYLNEAIWANEVRLIKE